MSLPKQSKPVMRTAQKHVALKNVQPSNLCTQACNLLSGVAKQACILACGIL